MTHPLTFQRRAMDIVLAFMMITSFPWIALGGRNHRTHQYDQNSINSISKPEGGNFGESSDWVKISKAPPHTVIANAGEALVLECEILGGPPPDVKWLKDGKVFYPSEQQDIGNYVIQGLFEGNEVEELDGNNLPGEADVLRRLTGGLVKVISRLQIPCVTPRHQGVYTCLAKLPASTSSSRDDQYKFPQTALSSTIVNVQEVKRNKKCPSPSQERLKREGAWIQEWMPVMMQTIGKGVVLSCRAEGNPKPTISWLDSTGKIVPTGDSDSRYRVLSTGELFIRELVWEDMGGYTCLVQNPIGKASETTFLYPARSEDQS